MKNRYRLLSILGIIVLSVMMVSCYSLWDDLSTDSDAVLNMKITLKDSDFTISYNDSDPLKIVFTADVSPLGLNDADVTWLVNSTEKGTGKTFEMKYSDYNNDVYQVYAHITKDSKTYTAQAAVKFDFVWLYEDTSSSGYVLINEDKIIYPFDGSGNFATNVKVETTTNCPDTVDAVTGEHLNLIRYKKQIDFALYNGEKDLYVDGSGCLTIDPTGNTAYGKKGSYYKGFDSGAQENSNFDMILLRDGGNTYLFPLNPLILESDLQSYKLVCLNESPVLYKDSRFVKYTDPEITDGNLNPKSTYQHSEGYLILNTDKKKYHIVEAIKFTASDDPPPP